MQTKDLIGPCFGFLFFLSQSAVAREEVSEKEVEKFLLEKNYATKAAEWKVLIAAEELQIGKTEVIERQFSYKSQYIDSDQNGKMNAADEGFFNPASTVKTAIAALVLETMNKHGFELEAIYKANGDEQWYSFEEDLEKMQVLSDNEATNRLILFLGFDEIRNRLKDKGIGDFSIERLMLGKGTLVASPAHQVISSTGIFSFPEKTAFQNSVCEEATGKTGNCAAMGSLIGVMKRLTNPDIYQSGGFEIRESDRLWLLDKMSQTPKELGYDYPDDWNRFISSRKLDLVGPNGKLISKGGVALWSKNWTDQSYLLTDSGRKIHLMISVRPPEAVTQKEAFAWMADLAVDFTRWMGTKNPKLQPRVSARGVKKNKAR